MQKHYDNIAYLMFLKLSLFFNHSIQKIRIKIKEKENETEAECLNTNFLTYRGCKASFSLNSQELKHTQKE